MIISAMTVGVLEGIQGQVARFILQLPSSASGVAGFIDAGLKPMGEQIKERIGLYIWTIVNKRRDPILTSVFTSVMRSGEDAWAKLVQDLDPAGSGLFLKPKSVVLRTILQAAIQTVTAKKREHVSLRYMPLPTNWFKLQPHVTDSLSSGYYAESGQGMLDWVIEALMTYKLYPFCLQNGSSVALNEAHAILECPASAYVRRVSDLQAYVDAYALGGGFLQSRVLRAYVGGDGVDVGALNQ